MSFNSALSSRPEVQVTIEFPFSWSRSFLADLSQCQELASAIADDIGLTMRTLGVPGVAIVSLSAVCDDELLPNRLLRIFVNDRWCPFPAEAWHFAWSYAADYAPDEPVGLLAIFDRLCATTEADPADVDLRKLLILACRAAIYEQPSALLGTESFSALLHHLELPSTNPAREKNPPSDTIRTAFEEVLDLGISISDIATVGSILAQAEENAWGNPMLAETLIAELRPTCIEIRLGSDDLRTLTTIAGQGKPSTYFHLLRDRLYRRLGVTFPHIRFFADNSLKNNTFGLTVNHLIGVPRIIGDFDHLLLGMEDVLHANGVRFINVADTKHLLSAISNMFPALVNDVCSIYTTAEIASTLRILMKGNISIRPIRSLLEGLLNARFVVADSLSVSFCNILVLSSEPAEGWMHKPEVLAACLRSNIKHYVTTQYAGLEKHVRVKSLDPALERELTKLFRSAHGDAPRTKNYTRQQVILDAIHRALKAGDRHISPPVGIITSNEAMMSLQELVRPELPELPVLSYHELLPDTVVQHQGCIRVPVRGEAV